MKIIIAGSRSITELSIVKKAIESSGWVEQITEVVSGNAKGVDVLGEMWARKYKIPIKKFISDWEKYRKGAGLKRNTEMAEYSDALILIHDGKSAGSINMLKQMKLLHKPVYYYLHKE